MLLLAYAYPTPTMNRLPAEQRRLYLVPNPTSEGAALMQAQGRVRALVVEIAQPAGWEPVAALCHGIQDELALPTPAIAVSGGAGFQVWLSLAEAVPVPDANRFLSALCQRFLSEVPPRHIQCLPSLLQSEHAPLVPALQGDTGRWSAFVAPGLASMFADEPWLSVPPGAQAQAQLLSRLESISPADLARVQTELGLEPVAIPPAPHAKSAFDATPAYTLVEATVSQVGSETDPRRFLLAVMNDSAVEMILRIEAAKALLPSRPAV